MQKTFHDRKHIYGDEMAIKVTIGLDWSQYTTGNRAFVWLNGLQDKTGYCSEPWNYGDCVKSWGMKVSCVRYLCQYISITFDCLPLNMTSPTSWHVGIYRSSGFPSQRHSNMKRWGVFVSSLSKWLNSWVDIDFDTMMPIWCHCNDPSWPHDDNNVKVWTNFIIPSFYHSDPVMFVWYGL